ncbi:hypothetical protein P8452_71241 [Trifolium repens]|nr:hypothetical protein P8452_71241 [Trifolium repens]
MRLRLRQRIRNYPRIWTAGGLALFAGRLAILYFCGEKVSNAVLSRGLGNIPNTSNTAMEVTAERCSSFTWS